MQKDVVVVGSGGAGMMAAIVAAHAGLEVLLVEKTQYFGGTTAYSGGGLWIPGNHLMSAAGLSDTRSSAEHYIKHIVGEQVRPEMLDAFLDNGPAMVRYLADRTAVQLMSRSPAPDYYTEVEGSTAGGRALGPPVFDGRRLGSYLSKLRPPFREFNAPFGMMLSPLDLMHILNARKTKAAFKYTANLVARFIWDRLRYSRGTRLTMGGALAASLLRSALDAGVTLWSESPAKALIKKGNRVDGVIVDHAGESIRVAARRGVVLATGGFAADPELARQYFPWAEQHQTLASPGSTGDGLRMALTVGAVIQKGNYRNSGSAVVSLLREANGTLIKCPHLFMDISKPGCIAVNKSGRRFGNEGNLHLAEAIEATKSVPAYLVCDHAFIKKYGLGLVWPGAVRLRKMVRLGYVTEAPTLRELAVKLGVDGEELVRTVDRNNAFAANGADLDFGRGDSGFDRSIGDPTHRPNPSLGPIANPPFYAVQVFPGDDGSSLTGLRANANGQVLDASDNPIAGLYACGLDMNSIWAGRAIANGGYHGVNMTFGYIISRHIISQGSISQDDESASRT
jgi:succinate dehydrogenase/fumarate reductase flavoprotein subunit